MRRIRLFVVASGLAIFAAFALNGIVASSSANLVLTCFKVSHNKNGNWKDPECKETAGNLKGEYVLAEPIVKTLEFLWCANLTPEAATGEYEDSKCTKKHENGLYIEVNVEPTKILPLPSKASPLTFTSKGGEGVLLTVGKNEVKCEKATDKGEFTSANLGTVQVTFEKCKAKVPIIGSAPCTGEGDSKEQILFKGVGHYWLALLSGKLVAALVILFNKSEGTIVHFTCEALGQKQLIIVEGCAASLAEPVEKLTKITKDVFKEEKSGVADIREVLPQETATEIKCISLTSVNGGAFEESAQTGTAENEGFKQGGAAVEVLLMNKEM